MPKGTPLTQTEIAEVMRAIEKAGGNKRQAAQFLGIGRSTLYQRLEQADTAPEEQPPSPFAVEHVPEIGTSKHVWEIKSGKDNKYRFAAFGDLHAASKYCRWDVREDLTKQAEEFGATAIFDAGNWADGEASFNRYDLECVGMDNQLKLLAKNYPKTKIPTYAVTGADHEGWWIRREGVDVGLYCESIMRDAGHLWTNLGYLEADITLVNANSGETATLRIMHAGGGSAYAISYKPQKILESLEGGEKPSVVLIGHYHKLDSGLVRNTWYAQVGCQQDQTPFMRQRSLEAHVGGILLEMEQDPEDGSILGFKPDMRRYFARAYYFKAGQANQRWSGHGPIRQVPRGSNVKG
jgi:hypothetical protein